MAPIKTEVVHGEDHLEHMTYAGVGRFWALPIGVVSVQKPSYCPKALQVRDVCVKGTCTQGDKGSVLREAREIIQFLNEIRRISEVGLYIW